jgi:signal transduction histidine kinase
MRRVLAGWDVLDPALSRLLRFNFAALGVATVVLMTVYALGFRHHRVVLDIWVMLLALCLMAASLPFTRRFGAAAPLLGLTCSATAFAVGATWVTPTLSPLTAMLMVVPLFVGFPYLPQVWVRVLMAYGVVGSSAIAALAEFQRRGTPGEIWQVNSTVIALSLPTVTAVMIYLVHNAYGRLREQADALRDTSTQLVQVAVATRRDIERDLHDGAQQRLLAMSVTIQRLRLEQAKGAAEEVARLVGQLAVDNRSALTELRELARGIYPPLLTERGLVAALQAAARRSPVPVVLRAERFPRQPKEREAAAYFCILEAVSNAVRHSGCSEVTISLRADRGMEFEVADDGSGFDQADVTMRGLLGLRARLTAAGGTLRISSVRGRGTVVTGRFPPA